MKPHDLLNEYGYSKAAIGVDPANVYRAIQKPLEATELDRDKTGLSRSSDGSYRREPHSRRDESRRTRTAYGEISYSQRRERATAPVIKPTTHGNIFRSQPQEIPHVRPLR